MRKHLLLAAAAALAISPAALAQQTSPRAGGSGAASEQAQLSAADQQFVEKAAIGGMFEVQSSDLAEDKTQSAEVREFAKQMVRDHGKANEELESLAEDLNAAVPTSMDAKHIKVLQNLRAASEGPEFDRAYVQAQRDAHKEAISLFTNYSKSNGNQQLTSWAEKTLPTLKEHQQHLQQVGGVAQGEGSSTIGRSSAEPMKQQKQNEK